MGSFVSYDMKNIKIEKVYGWDVMFTW
jgi:hypothetical protein